MPDAAECETRAGNLRRESDTKPTKKRKVSNMKTTGFFTLLLVSATFLGCNKPPDQSSNNQQMDQEQVRTKASDALNAAKDTAVQTKDQFVTATDKKLSELFLDAKIDGSF